MITAIDTNVLLDVFLNDPAFGRASADKLRQCLQEGIVVACDQVWAECAAVFPDETTFRQEMHDLHIRFEPIGLETAIHAGMAWRRYRSGGGKRNRMVADFMIGAHAVCQCDRLLTRDRGFYRSYFNNLSVLDPTI